MAVAKLAALLVAAVFAAVAVWQSTAILVRSGAPPAKDEFRAQLSVVIGLLMTMPVLALALLAAVIFLVIQDEAFTRFAHALFLIGAWMSAGVSITALAAAVRQGSPSLILPLANVVLMVAAAVYFTPISHFLNALPPLSIVWPFAVGLALSAICYAALFRLRATLSAPQSPLTDSGQQLN